MGGSKLKNCIIENFC